MTFTFKLSRRLAAARLAPVIVLAGLASLAACGSEGLVDSSSQNPSSSSLDTVVVTPGAVTAETKQPIKLGAYGRSEAGDSVALSDLQWTATGGTISPDGTFIADAPGSYTLTAYSKGHQHSGRGTVVVVPPAPSLIAVVVSPASVSLAPNAKQAFTAAGRLSDGTTSTVGVTWTASGGVIDAAGFYTAGATAGAYRVIATNASSGLADTATVQIGSPAALTPTVQAVLLTPGAISLSTGASQQLTAVARMSDGSTAPLTVTYAATGGSVSANGLFTAGQTAGAYRVIATQAGGALADTAAVTIAAPAAPSSRYPNQPAGMSTVIENDFSSIPGGISGWWGTPTSSNISVAQDASAPVSGGSVLDTKFPSGMNSGVAPVTWRAWQQALSSSSPRYRKLYVSTRVKIPGADFQNQSVGTKLWYVGYGNTTQDNDAFLMLHGNGATSDMSAMQVMMYVSETDDADGPSYSHGQNVDSRLLFTAGSWHNLEVYMEQGSVDQHDGVLKVWIDGTLVSSYSNMKFLDSRHSFTQGFFMWQWTPVWGGVGGTRTRDDHVLLDHLYIAGAN